MRKKEGGLILVLGCTFLLGAYTSEYMRHGGEQPAHTVITAVFFLVYGIINLYSEGSFFG